MRSWLTTLLCSAMHWKGRPRTAALNRPCKKLWCTRKRTKRLLPKVLVFRFGFEKVLVTFFCSRQTVRQWRLRLNATGPRFRSRTFDTKVHELTGEQWHAALLNLTDAPVGTRAVLWEVLEGEEPAYVPLDGLTSQLADPAANFSAVDEEARVISGIVLKLTEPEAAPPLLADTAPMPGYPQAAAAHAMATPVPSTQVQQRPGSGSVKRGRNQCREGGVSQQGQNEAKQLVKHLQSTGRGAATRFWPRSLEVPFGFLRQTHKDLPPWMLNTVATALADSREFKREGVQVHIVREWLAKCVCRTMWQASMMPEVAQHACLQACIHTCRACPYPNALPLSCFHPRGSLSICTGCRQRDVQWQVLHCPAPGHLIGLADAMRRGPFAQARA